jgi:inorganic pyrophosphatase
MEFPYDFGFVPSTIAGDGDPLDVLVLMDSPAFAGCVLQCRVIGVILGQQQGANGEEENDRIIAVEVHAHSFTAIKRLADLGKRFVKELEDFFVNYHELDDEKYEVLEAKGPKAARRCVKQAIQKAKP